jgi:probable rRNA maturation factor
MDSIEIINLIKKLDMKEYRKDFKAILKEVKKVLEIDNKLSLSLTICDNEYIRVLNKQYRDIDKETDVLSFALEDDANEDDLLDMIDLTGVREIGDIIISIDRVKSQAQEYGHSERREICFLFTHGLLHLLGYDHLKEDEEKEMFGLQELVLSNLGINR